jgi:hypothetical protein
MLSPPAGLLPGREECAHYVKWDKSSDAADFDAVSAASAIDFT